MTSGLSLEILDLRHFTAQLLRPLLEAEGDRWRERLHWDYRASARLLLQYLDSRMLPGYAALDTGRVAGYAFCVYEETKAVIGDVFALPPDHAGAASLSIVDGSRQTAREVEGILLRHMFETLQHSPQVDRIESQLLLHTSGAHTEVFANAGFRVYQRLFMVQPLKPAHAHVHIDLSPELELRPWRDDDLHAASRLISTAYAEHPDSRINDQYRSPQGSLRFLHNIVRYAGCGTFSPRASHTVVERATQEIVALVLGSRVSPESGHITQLCVAPRYRRNGLARMLLSVAAGAFVRQDAKEVSLTVTEANSNAVQLYRAEGYGCAHMFDAAVWER